MLSCFFPMPRIIGVMALLTQSSEIGWVAVFGRVVKMSNRENYLHLFACLWVEPHGLILHSAELASVVGSL